jgi:hypothetical protein
MQTRQYSRNNDSQTEFLSFVLASISELFAFESNGRTTYQPEDIAIATLLICCLNTSAETIQLLEALPSADRILARMSEEKGLQIGTKINQLLKKRVSTLQLPKGVKKTVAADVTENPFYGNKNNPAAMGGKPKPGTKYFYKYLTFSLVIEGHRYPVGFYPLTQLHLPKLSEIIQQEVEWLRNHNLCERILLDRGFNDMRTYNLLNNMGIEFLMPIKKNVKLKEVFSQVEPHITKYQKKHGFVLKDYRPTSWQEGIQVVVCWLKVRGGSGKPKWKWIFFVTNLKLRPLTLVFIYKRRWGIETGYRQIHTLQAFTNSRRFAIRVFLVGIAFLLFSAWIHVNWLLARDTQRKSNNLLNKSPIINLKHFKTTITLPQFRLILILVALRKMSQTEEKIIDA